MKTSGFKGSSPDHKKRDQNPSECHLTSFRSGRILNIEEKKEKTVEKPFNHYFNKGGGNERDKFKDQRQTQARTGNFGD
jgi:hypothetical protein